MRRFMSMIVGGLVVSSMAACAVEADEDVAEEAAAIEGIQRVGKTVRVDGDGLRLRTGPSTDRTVLGLLYRGDQVEIVESRPTDGFYKVAVTAIAAPNQELLGKQGWIAGQYLTDGTAPSERAEGEELGPVACRPPSNGTLGSATVLQDFTDHRSGRFQDAIASAAIGRREAWFRFNVMDQGLNGNPDVRVSVTGDYEVTVFYACDSGGDAPRCSRGEAVTVGQLTGCAGVGVADVATSCNSNDDSGLAVVRIRRRAGDTDTCSNFDMQVQIN